jgi:adenosylhomocysteinase
VKGIPIDYGVVDWVQRASTEREPLDGADRLHWARGLSHSLDEFAQQDASLGEAEIEWVRQRSPVLGGLVSQRLSDGALSGRRFAVVLQLEAKTAFLATVLADAGAKVVVAGSNPRTTRGPVVRALIERGLNVVARPGGNHESWERELLAAADTVPEYVIDDGAELTIRMARHRPELFGRLKGVTEQTTTGTARLQSLSDEGLLPFPALSANDARCKHLFDNVYGTGQTTLQALLKLTNRQIGGTRLAVFGYGYVGRGVARFARAMGAVTYVVETDPVRALEAHMDGHAVGTKQDVLPEAAVVITATGCAGVISGRDLPLLRGDVVLANAGHQDFEIDVAAIEKAASQHERPRPGVESYRIDDKDVHLLTAGALVNIAGGMGHPVEIMDLSFAVQALGAHYLVTNELAPGVHVIPRELDDAIAVAKLTSLGVRSEQIQPLQEVTDVELADETRDVPEPRRGGPDGESRIAWARRSMPVLTSITERLAEEKVLDGLHVGVCLVLEPKTANLALTLQAAGADVSLYCAGRNASELVARALSNHGMQVFAEEGASRERDAELARGLLSAAPNILIDDGATLIRLLHREFPHLLGSVLGGAEETTSGVRPLRVMQENGELRIPVIAVNDARTKYLFDNVYGTGQSCVMAMLDVTNMQLAGRKLVVVGYGWVGRGVARYAAALGARVVVSEIDPIKALLALHEGYEVRNMADAAETAEIVVAATGLAGAVTPEHLANLPDGAILCTAGGGSFELPMAYLDSLGTATEVRQAVTQYKLPTSNRILVVSAGDCVNCAAGEGNPIEIMDMSLSLQALAVECIATEARNWPPGVYSLTPQLEESVAMARLRHEGASVQDVTEDIAAAMRHW